MPPQSWRSQTTGLSVGLKLGMAVGAEVSRMAVGGEVSRMQVCPTVAQSPSEHLWVAAQLQRYPLLDAMSWTQMPNSVESQPWLLSSQVC